MRINNNISAINIHRQMTTHVTDVGKSMERLSSGLRINRAADDAAGLAISEKMRAQIRGLAAASKNAQDTISMIQTAEGALCETQSVIQRIRELAVQAANDTNTDADRSELQAEVKQLLAEITRIGNTTEFNTKKLLDGSAKGVAEEVVGSSRINNNSSLTFDTSKIKNMGDSVSKDKSWAFDGAYMLVKTNQTFDGGNPSYKAEDYMIVGPNGALYKFTTLTADTAVTGNELKAGTIIAEGNYKLSNDIVTSGINITLGDVGVDVTEESVTKLAAGSVLAKDSTVTMEAGAELKIEVSGKEVKIKWDDGAGVFNVNGEAVALNKSVTLEDGAIIQNDGGGKFTVTEGRVKLAEALNEDNASAWILTQDSVLATGSTIAEEDDKVFKQGTVISAADSFVPGSIVFNLGQNIQFSANTDDSLAADYYKIAVGDGVTFVFSKYQPPSSRLNDSVMAQIGANSGQTVFVSIGDMRAPALGVADIDISTKWGAATAIETADNALQSVSHQRAMLGAMQNRLEHTIKSLDTAAENLQAAESRIRDVDMAREIMEFTKHNLLLQVSQAMLAQANSQPKNILALLNAI